MFDWKNFISNREMIIYTVSLAVVITVLLVICFALLSRRRKLNWYDRNLLEMSSNTVLIRYSGTSIDSDTGFQEDQQSLIPSGSSRPSLEPILDVPCHGMQTLAPKKSSIMCRSMPSLDTMQIESSPSPRSETKTFLDVSDKFYVPKSRSGSFSMFQRFDKNMINKDLYDVSSRQDVIPTEEQILGQCGSIQMAVSFDSNLNLLCIKLIQASNLTSKTDTNPSPYFKVTLIAPTSPDHVQTYQSKTYVNQRSPDLGEEFCFEIRSSPLDQYKLEIVVYDHDQYYVDECIGRCCISIGRIDISDDPSVKTVFWAEIMSSNTNELANAAGDILLSISYLSKAQRLIATIIKARNLPSDDHSNEPLNPYVKLTLYCKKKRLKQKKTTTKRDTHCPEYNEALAFDITATTPLSDIILEFCVYNEQSAFRSHKLISKLILPLTKCKDLWRALIRGEDTKFKWYHLEKV